MFRLLSSLQRGHLRQDGAPAGAAVDLLHLSRPVPEPQAAAMSALGVHGALHGGPRRLCPSTGTVLESPMTVTRRGAAD